MTKILLQKFSLYKVFADKSPVERILLLSGGFSILLVVLRITVTGSLMYGFLPWNLFLAWIPYSISKRLIKIKDEKNNARFIVLSLTWLLFIPNSFYIITDLFHLEQGVAAPQWFDLALIFSFAWNGLMMGVLSMQKMEIIISEKIGFRWLFVYVIMWLNALGIYIGRYLRFNSWDIITNPFQLISDILYLCFHPLRNKSEWAMIICFAVLMTLIYKSLINLHKENVK